MGSFGEENRGQGPSRRRDRKQVRRKLFHWLEGLEDRTLLSVANPYYAPTTTNLADIQHGPMANLGGLAVNLYQTFLQKNGNTAAVAAAYPDLSFQNDSVMFSLSTNGGFNETVAAAKNLGMKVVQTNATFQIIDGWMPISQLPKAAQLPNLLSGHAVVNPVSYALAVNEGDFTMYSNVVRQNSGLTGAGQTVGIISDSFNNLGTYSADVTSGDLPAGINVVKEGTGGSDEGRGMAQNIYKIAPGAGLAFATAGVSVADMADSVTQLANAGSTVIVDDIGWANDPYFQPGVIAQSIRAVVADNIPYLAAAANMADNGYLSNFRGVSSTVTGLGAGRFMNFNPGGSTLALPITVSGAGGRLVFQFDQPFNTQQIDKTNMVTSQVNFYLLDQSTGNILYSGTNDNTQTQEPFQFITGIAAGTYNVVIQVIKGPDPGHVQFVQFGGPDIAVPKTYGNAGGTFYPTSFGHNADTATIGIGAMPWWATYPSVLQTPIRNETFSSFGPQIQVRDANGNLLSSPIQVVNPTVTGPDGTSTTFFGNPPPNDTTLFNPPTTTNLYAIFTPSQVNTYAFFGTSSAAPNVAAVVALMLEKAPTATPAQIRSALATSARPMNATPAGQLNLQSGFGLVDAIGAINAIDLLRVSTTDPANGATVTTAPGGITVTFTKAVLFSTVQASDLVFTALPAGITVTVGTPVAVDDPNRPTTVFFPYTFTRASGTATANGAYTYQVNGPISATDGKALVPSGNITFTLADTAGPRITSVTTLSRTVTITFSEAMDASTINLANLMVVRQGNTGNWNNGINLNADPRVRLTYDPTTRTATLDYSELPQTAFPSDRYAILVNSTVTDQVGNQLDGEFSGTFPSGNGTAGGTFFDDLGYLTLQAPVITSFVMTSGTDSGIGNDQNTNLSQPIFIGQVFNSFLGTSANLQVYIQFNGLHPELSGDHFNLTPGAGTPPRGTAGSYDMVVTTNSAGAFSFVAPVLPEGFQRARLVVVGGADSPPLPGLSSQFERAFRIDKTSPSVTAVSLVNGETPTSASPNLASLQSIQLDVTDPVNQAYPYLGTPAAVLFPAIDPTTASNISNYSLIRTNADGTTTDASQFLTSAAFVATAATTSGIYIGAYNGNITLNFASGLPGGNYTLVVHTTQPPFPGLLDAAGNPLAANFTYSFSLATNPVYVTNLQMQSTWNPLATEGANTVGGLRSYYEVASTDPTYIARASAPPSAWVVDLSTPIPYTDYSGRAANALPLQLIGSANAAAAAADGAFGTLGASGLGSTGSGFHIVNNVSLLLYNYDAATGTSTLVAPGGQGNRLVLTYNGGTLAPDYYRLYMPNQVNGGLDTRLFDIYGNQLDGEFLGDQTNTGAYETLLSDGTYRTGMSGDGVSGGAFTTGFVVVPTGNILFARPDYQEDPLLSSTEPDGSLAKPYSALAPESNPNTAPANPTNDPNGGQNDSRFFLSGFNRQFDRNGNGVFDRSALYAASQLALSGPVVVVALPGTPQRNPITGAITQQPFVLQAPAGSSTLINDASASVPFDTTLVFTAGSALKAQNASLFVQNQGSAIQALGGFSTASQVNFTSYNDTSVGGATNNNPVTTPRSGDWGGIVLRSYNQAAQPTATFPIDTTLKGINGLAVSGSDDVMSIINNSKIQYGGGSVPQSSGTFYSGITLYNARPAITNDIITRVGGTNAGLQGAIGADMDSFRQDDTAWGPLVRRTTVTNNSLNGIWLMAERNGFVQPTNAVPLPNNPASLGGRQNYVFFEALPIVVTAQLVVGQQLLVNTGGNTSWVGDRLYAQPGTMLKFNQGSSLAVLNPDASLNVGSRSYITGFDLDSDYGPGSDGFEAESADDPQVLFTSLYDDAAVTALVPSPIDVTGDGPTTVTSAMWGGVGIQSGAKAVINAATFQYGGGAINTPTFTMPSQSVLAFITRETTFDTPGFRTDLGSKVYITNNNFFHNFDAAMQIEPNGLLAGDPLHPLVSGHPFFRGNVMQNNGIDGLAVVTNRLFLHNGTWNYLGPIEVQSAGGGYSNQDVNAVWDSTDLTYVLRGTLILDNRTLPDADPDEFVAEPTPTTTLTIQAALPGTVLANGETIPNPGASVLVKLLNDLTPNGKGTFGQFGTPGIGANQNAGAGFVVGVDNTVDPDADAFLDPGAFTQLRILGIAGNQTTGQQRVPVILTSLRDTTVGVTARGVKMADILHSTPAWQSQNPGAVLNTPATGDGGIIYIGGNSLTDYNLLDPRDGSLIDNADLRYLTRIEMQGGGIITVTSDSPDAPSWFNDKSGIDDPITQFNAAMAMTISNSRIDSFSDAAVFVHPNSANGLQRIGNSFGVTRGGFRGQGVNLFMYNNTISNSGLAGIHVESETVDNTTAQSPNQIVLLNNTFYNNPTAITTNAPQWNGQNSLSHTYTFAMNNIFVGSTGIAVNIQGQAGFSNLQYNLFFNNATNLIANTTDGDFAGNNGVVNADPQFVNPGALNFALQPTSPAIDASRSEMGPFPAANVLFPAVTPVLDDRGGIRTDPASLPFNQIPGGSNQFGGFGFVSDPRQIVTPPGSGSFTFYDQWVAALPTADNAYTGPASNAGTYAYTPIRGQRDALGMERIDDATVKNVGFGRYPFLDLGAIEYVNLNPTKVAAVTAQLQGSTTATNFYTVGGKAGASTTPNYLYVTFTGAVDPDSLNASTVYLQALGVTGNNTPGTRISLAGKLAFDQATETLTISLGASGLVLTTDAYQLVLVGSGAQVISNPQGIALDGESLSNGNDPTTGVQLPLPSGDGNPGGNFYNNFIINSTPSSITPGTFKLASASDTNIVGDLITSSNLPSFVGTITEPNPDLVPTAGQTVLVDVGVALTNPDGTTTVYFADSPNIPAWLPSFLRNNAGSALTDASGAFNVAIGVDAANTGLVTNGNALPDSPYNVGSSGQLVPLPGTVSAYYVARARVIDQSGNQSSSSAPAARANFVVDTTAPTVSLTSPTDNSVVSPGVQTFVVETSENMDLTHFTSSQIQLLKSAPDGSFGAGATTIGIANISVTYLDAGIGGSGRERITFTSSTALANGLYRLTLVGSGTDGIRDIAGNSPASGDVTSTFAVFSSTATGGLFVGASYATDATAAVGSRENPYATIAAAMAAAGVGDRLLILPGVYTESVNLGYLVSMISVSAASTDSVVYTGDALSTIIRSPAVSSGTTTTTITGQNIPIYTNTGTGATFQSTISGLTIASALIGDPALGSTNPQSVAIWLSNAAVLVQNSYIINSGTGIYASTSGSNAPAPTIANNVIAGNSTGLSVVDGGSSNASTTNVINNSFVYNTWGLIATNGSTSSSRQVYAANNIFWQNNDRSTSRQGGGVYSSTVDKVVLNNNLFSGNGPSDTDNTFAAVNIGNGFSSSLLGPAAANAQANLGNFTGWPAFVAPRDPRPGADGPATFLRDANFGLTASSAAVNNALASVATRTDILGNAQNPNPTSRGFQLPGYGPRDVGAFEYVPAGTGTTGTVGGTFRIVTTSLVPDGSTAANGSEFDVYSTPNSVTVRFSRAVDKATVDATDLVLSGSLLNSLNPARATSVTWLDDHTAQFNLSGQLNANGTVSVSLAAGSVKSANGASLPAYADKVYIKTVPMPTTPTTPTSPTTPTTPTTPTSPTTPVVNPVTPPPATAPTSPNGKKVKVKAPTAAQKAAARKAAAAKQAAARKAAAEKKAAAQKAAAAKRAAQKVAKPSAANVAVAVTRKPFSFAGR